jgi:hypothetical protein
MQDTNASLAVVERLYEEGLEMKRAQFRRKNPDLTDRQIEQLVRQWILDRPFDCPGKVTKL